MNNKNRIDYINIGYVAGIIDGEGSISLTIKPCIKNKCGFTFKFYMEISSTNENLMKKLISVFGEGKYRKKYYRRRPWRNPSYIYSMNRKIIEIWFPKIIPHLVIKKQQATLLMKFFDLNLGQGFKMSETQLEMCKEISRQIVKLNKRPTKKENILQNEGAPNGF